MVAAMGSGMVHRHVFCDSSMLVNTASGKSRRAITTKIQVIYDASILELRR